MPPGTRSLGRGAAAGAVLAVAGLLALQITGFHGLRYDDAFITYRYGQNLATGNGLVFNLGERVMGSTSASFPMLLTTLATQAMVTLGQVANPVTGKADIDLPYARHFIDTLQMLEEKTRGNLTPDEAGMLSDLLHDLRLAYVAVRDQPAGAG
jgi:hypothetical protein